MSARSRTFAYDIEEMRRRLNAEPERDRADLVRLVSMVLGSPNGLTTSEMARAMHGTDRALLDLTRERVLRKCERLVALKIFDTMRIEQPTPRARSWPVRPAPLHRKVYRIHEDVLNELESSKPARARGR